MAQIIITSILVRSSLDTMTQNQVLEDIMTDDTYRDDDEKEEKKEKKDEKKKSVAFKATSSKGKAKQESSSKDCGGINRYTLTARLGPAWIRGFGPLEDDARLGQPVRNPTQGIKADLEINQDPGRLE